MLDNYLKIFLKKSGNYVIVFNQNSLENTIICFFREVDFSIMCYWEAIIYARKSNTIAHVVRSTVTSVLRINDDMFLLYKIQKDAKVIEKIKI